MRGPSQRTTIGWLLLALVTGHHVQQASAAVSLKMPVIPWYSVLRGGYVDLITKQPVTSTMTAATVAPLAPAAQGAFQPQNSLLNPAPRPTSRTVFPITLPNLDFWEKCFKETDTLSALITKCNYQDTYTTCAQLANMGYLPKGVQAFEADKLTGSFNVPTGCTSGSLGVSYDKLFRMTFNSPQVPILAVITKDHVGSMVSYFGTGSTQGRVRHRLATKAEFCYSPTLSEISVTKSAIYSTGMQPGTTSWTFSKSVELAPPYTGGRAVMFNGDSVDATWTLEARKSGIDVNYQGVVSGTISINNPTPAVITVTSVTDQVSGGPASTVACPVGTPFTVPACSFATCQYTAYYPTQPPAGTYTAAAQVGFQVLGSQGYPSNAQGSAVFNVGSVGSMSALSTSAGQIPAGSAMVTDLQSPQQTYTFSGPGQQSFQTTLTCSAASPSGAVSNTATLTAANGQQISQSATVQKQCYDLQVSVATKASPFVGRWGWEVSKSATPTMLTLRPDQAASPDQPSLFGRDYASTTSGDVVYSVTYTRNPPAGFAAGVPAFEAAGEVYVGNPAPINARIQGVFVSISNSRGGQAYVTQATCPVLTIPAGQRITCTWKATPTFNPVGQQVRGTARYLNTRNGQASGSTTDFSSAPATIGGGVDAGGDDGAGGEMRRRLQQTWGGASRATTVGVIPEMQPAVATTIYAVDGRPVVVPSSVANGTGVIVSGGNLGTGSPAGDALLASTNGVPVILPSPVGGSNHGVFVQEAGPAGLGSAVASAAADVLSGLQDECVDVADTFITGDSAVQGRLISGARPSGRICSTTSFTYTMRYGPYADCVPRKAINAATFQTVDTRTRGSSQADIAVKVEGCANPSVLKVLPLNVTTSARGGYTWSVTKRASRDELALGQDASATVAYTVEYKRVGAKSGAALSADVTVTNPSAYPIPIEAASYTATTICDGGAKVSSGPVSCEDDAVPAKGKTTCRIAAALPCANYGAYTVVLTAGGGYSVSSAPVGFTFNTTQLAKANSNSECADVKDVFTTGAGRIAGAVVDGKRPNGRLCGSKTFTYTVKFGPFSKCGAFKAINTASLWSNSTTKSATATSTLPVNVIGCSVYTDMARTADCVNDANYWPRCDSSADQKCASGWKLLPGGKGKGTLFFPKPNERSTRTYGAMLNVAAPATLASSKKVYLDAAREFVAAQLNFLSGARLPTVELQDAYDAVSKFLATTSEGSAMSMDQVGVVKLQAGLLGRYNNGTLPTSFKAPQRCR